MVHLHLTVSWRGVLSYRNHSIDLQSKSMDWFLYMITASVMKELKIVIKLQIFQLSYYSPLFLFYTPWKHLPSENIRKPLGLLMFSGGIEKQHRTVMG